MIYNPLTQKQLNDFVKSPSHAVGLSGQAGAGKASAAADLAAQLLDVAKSHSNPYIKIMDLKTSKTGIDDIRSLNDFLVLKVPGDKNIKRVAILLNIDYLRTEAQNAVLKTLEEPPQDTVIICTFSNSNLVLPTIHSRLRQLNIMPVSLEDALSRLEYDQSAIKRAFYMSNGLAGLMIAILDNQDEHELVSAINQARELIGMDRYQRMSKVDQIIKDRKIKPDLIIEGMYRLVSASYKASLQAGKSNLKGYVSRLEKIEQALSDLRDNVSAKLVFSRLFFEL